ncbi:hypothetical protein DYB38_006691 [Aphanomyces astaci]|uniref:Protein kinase domain-containing protein n=3 Tax=Aphanomyces astaci TaxID=112090 RepID=A0A397APF4_APHAT|nr:hypothetical protein DYB36_008502 [Aphanomyces astaci]RHY56652.1 hypothetical protein DYB38_006691 [Aphanomyces astaci]
MSAAPCPYGSMNASRIFVAGPLCKGNVSDVCVVDSKCALVTKNISSVGIEGTITMTYVNGYKTGWDSVDAIGDLSNLLFIETNTSNIPKTLPVNLFDWYAYDLLPTNKLQEISNVKFKKGMLKSFVLSDANISHFELDPNSFGALDSLGPFQILNQSFFDAQEYGFRMNISNITQDAQKCEAVKGVVTELWSLHAAINKKTYSVSIRYTVVDGTYTGLIVGVAIGVVILVAAVCFFIRRRNRKPDAEFEYQREGGKSAGGTTTTRFITDNTATGIDMSELTLYRLNQQDVVPQKKIASGAYAHVLYGTYKGTPVAIKKLLSSHVGVSEVQGLIDEIKLLASFTSPYVVKLVGCCWDQPSDLECVLEYMNAGDLRDNLIARTSVDFTWNEKIHVIAAIVDALAYLHSMPVIHRDLKSRNVLLDSVKSAKLTDFGVSKEDTQETMTVGVGTYRWMAPEILQVNHYSVAADVFSFGMILSELDTHNIPYADVTNPKNGKPLVDTAIMSMVIAGTIKPTFSHTMPKWVRDMAQQCIATDPEDRPTAMMLSNVVRKQIKRETHQLGV